MNSKLLYVGLNVDSKGISGCIVTPNCEIIHQFRSKPNITSLTKQLEKHSDHTLKICYEASFSAFSLYRDLKKKGYNTEIIAPSLIPKVTGKRVKTDKLDAQALAKHYAKELLTPIYIPHEQDEALRDLIRSRSFVVDQIKKTKQFIISLCRRQGWDYKNESTSINPSYWTVRHEEWLAKKVKSENSEAVKLNFNNLIFLYKNLKEQQHSFEQDIERLSQSERYKTKVKSLRCYRGIETLTAMTIITELGDVRRFNHPAKLTSYIGLDIVEYSSGGREKKFGISKLGNKTLRKTIIESCQLAESKPVISLKLKRRRKEATKKDIEIADRCMRRLHIKGTRLLARGKIKNKVKVACAREMMNFVWESLTNIENQQQEVKGQAAHG